MVFCDSLQFLLAFLEKLTASLAKACRGKFYNPHELVSQIYLGSDVELLERTGVICYNYVDCFALLDEQALPPRAAFFNQLSESECMEADYAQAQQEFENFQCESLKDYMQLYFLCDIWMLSDVFQMIQNNSNNEYLLGPAYFVSAPQLA